MAKQTQITIFNLLDKYLTSLGVPKSVLNIELLPARYEEFYSFLLQNEHNLVAHNKKGSSGSQTHISVSRRNGGGKVFFTDAQFASATTTNTLETAQPFKFFEANIAAMLARRSTKLSANVIATAPQGTYITGSANVISGTGTKWLGIHSGNTQIHLGKNNIDSKEFLDFRLGILLGDYLVFLKDKYSNDVLAISLPYEFVKKYTVVKPKPVAKAVLQKTKDEDNAADALYVAATGSSITPIVTNTPQPAPSPKAKKPGKPRYSANPAIGKGALQQAGYTCENCGGTTFTARSTGKAFMEPHHLIPISQQGLYSNNIDITQNLICLCPNCHSQIHYGLKNDIKTMLRKFLTARQTDLKNLGGIDIDESTLFAYYKL
jgi:5-methylcytosine-specific restriction endonuclease McrA